MNSKVPNCCGCGVCVGMCPVNAITMISSNDGGYIANIDKKTCIKCFVCNKVCPNLGNLFVDLKYLKSFFPKGQKFHPLLGYYTNAFIGFDEKMESRLKSPSGGIVSWTLKKLISENIVDSVYCPKYIGTKNELFSFVKNSSIYEIDESKGSVYYPVHFGNAINQILSSNETCAVVALPCLARALRKAISENNILKKRIKYIFGLVCGQMKSKFFTDVIFKLASQDIDYLGFINYRLKHKNIGYGNLVCRLNQKSKNEISKTISYGSLFMDQGYTLPCCRYCIEVFPLYADAVFMDAWIPKYKGEFEGSSIVITRDENIQNIYEEGFLNNEIYLESISESIVLESQEAAIRNKLCWNPLRTGINIPDVFLESEIVKNEWRHIGLCDKILHKADFFRANNKICYIKTKNFKNLLAEHFFLFFKNLFRVLRYLTKSLRGAN